MVYSHHRSLLSHSVAGSSWSPGCAVCVSGTTVQLGKSNEQTAAPHLVVAIVQLVAAVPFLVDAEQRQQLLLPLPPSSFIGGLRSAWTTIPPGQPRSLFVRRRSTVARVLLSTTHQGLLLVVAAQQRRPV
jgi:hypothetical protein